MVVLLFKCEVCGAVYDKHEIASKCDEHSNEFNACNIEYLKMSIGTVGSNKFDY